jgi:hypothetical protein
MPQHKDFTAPEIANLLAAQAVAASTSYLEGRSDGAKLAHEADRIFLELQMIGHDPACNAIADPTRLMVVAMMRTAVSTDARGARWAEVMKAFVPLLRQESTELATTGAQRI